MRTLMRIVALAALIVGITTAAHAHDLPWRDGDARRAAFGHCAKGPCTNRANWSAGKPHRHVRGETVFVKERQAHDASPHRNRGFSDSNVD